MNRSGRLAFVPPRFGDEVIGGAEAVIRETALGLADRGWDVDVLTTCARDHFTWANEYEPGDSTFEGVTIKRFPTVLDTARAERAGIGQAIHAGSVVDLTRQQRWMNDDLRVPELYHHLLDHSDRYRAIVFAPYLFWTTFACGQIDPARTILMPCLHDEPEAHLELFQPLFTGARGIWFLSEPEAELANRMFSLGARQQVVGSGIHVPESYDPDGFRHRHGIEGRFLLYAGRREGGKKWEWLLDAFGRATRRQQLPFQLVTMGTGEVHPPADLADRVIDLGFLDPAERNDAFAAADAYLQPSPLESFSRTIMEAWLAGTPVIANAASDVVVWHCDRSGAGLTFDDADELEQCLAFVAEAPEQARAMAAGGRDYVLKHYQWPSVLDAMEDTLALWTNPPAVSS